MLPLLPRQRNPNKELENWIRKIPKNAKNRKITKKTLGSLKKKITHLLAWKLLPVKQEQYTSAGIGVTRARYGRSRVAHESLPVPLPRGTDHICRQPARMGVERHRESLRGIRVDKLVTTQEKERRLPSPNSLFSPDSTKHARG